MKVLSSWQIQLLGLLGVCTLLVGIHQVVAVDEQIEVKGSSSTNNDPPHDNNHNDNDNNMNKEFCHGMYMTMFTDGFRFSLTSSKNDSHHSPKNNSTDSTPPCLAYYVHSWKLNMSGKFRGAMVFSFLLALLTEGLAATRFVLIDYLHKQPPSPRYRKLLLTGVYALQSWLGTMIMLVAMMYSVELLLSIIAGLMVGNFLFVRDHPQQQQQQRSRTITPLSSSSGGGVPPQHSTTTASAILRPENTTTTLRPAAFGGGGEGSESQSNIGLQMQTSSKEE